MRAFGIAFCAELFSFITLRGRIPGYLQNDFLRGAEHENEIQVRFMVV